MTLTSGIYSLCGAAYYLVLQVKERHATGGTFGLGYLTAGGANFVMRKVCCAWSL